MVKILNFIALLRIISVIGSCKKDEVSNVIFQDDLSVDKGKWLVNSTVKDQRTFSNGHYNIKVVSSNYDSYSVARQTQLIFRIQFKLMGL
jgi:hypothetical protein